MEVEIERMVNEQFLGEVARAFGVRAKDCELLGKVENFVYRFHVIDEPRILRLTHSSHRTRAAIEAELDWITHLANNGVAVARPLPSCASNRIESFEVKQGRFFAVSFEYAPGRLIDTNNVDDWNNDLFRAWGRVLGQMHNLSCGYEAPAGQPKRHAWHEDDLLFARAYLLKQDEPVIEALQRLLVHLHALPTPENAYGLIHSDLHRGNFHLSDNGLTVFDFDDCNYNWFAQDLAMAVYYSLWGVDGELGQFVFIRRFWRELMSGYGEFYELDKCWLELIPTLLKLRDIVIYVLIHKKWAGRVLPEHLLDVRARLRTRILCDEPCISFDFTETEGSD